MPGEDQRVHGHPSCVTHNETIAYLPTMSHPLLERVRSVKRRARRLVRLYAMLFFLAIFLACALVAGSADYVLRYQDHVGRIAATVSLALVAAYAFVRLVYPAARFRASDVRAAQQIERCFPQLSDRLSTAVAFLEEHASDPGTGSKTLREAAILDASRQVAALELEHCLDTRPAWRAVAALAVVLAGVVTAFTADTGASVIAARRLLLPWGGDVWPRRNSLVWQKQPRRLALGADFECALTDRDGRLPDSVTFYWSDDEEGQPLQHDLMEIRDGIAYARLKNVSRSLRYRAAGGDDDTMPWTHLDVVEPARVSDFSVQLFPPDYMQLPSTMSQRHIRAWAGTRIAVTGQLDKPLRGVTLVAKCAGSVVRHAAAMDRGGRRFTLSANSRDPWVVQESGTYWLELRDATGFTTDDLTGSELRVQKDAPPTISLAAPTAGACFTSKSLVSISAVAKDDLGILSVELESGGTRRELYHAAAVAPATANRALPASTGETRVVQYDWDLAELKGLGPGDVVEFRLITSDRRPQTGATDPVRLNIISPDELESRIDQRQSNLSQRVREALAAQQTTRDQTQAWEDRVKKAGSLRREDVEALQSAELGQRRVQQILNGPRDGAVALVDFLAEELKSNRVDRPELTLQLDRLRTAIQQINDELLTKIQFELARVLKESKAAIDAAPGGVGSASPPGVATIPFSAALNAAVTAVGSLQADVINRLEEILDSLTEWEDNRRLAQDVAAIRLKQERIAGETQALTTTGQDLASLPAASRGELKRLSQRQLDLARELDRLQGRLTSGLAGKPGAGADTATVQEALDTMRRLKLSGQMRQGAQDVDANRIGQAVQLQQAVLQGLTELLDVLARRPDNDPERVARELADAGSKLDSLLERQQALLEEMGRVRPLSDDAERARQLSQVAETQRSAATDATAVAPQLEKLQAAEAARSTAQAGSSMEQAASAAAESDLDRAEEQARQALAQLQSARSQLAEKQAVSQQSAAAERLQQLRQSLADWYARQQSLAEKTKSSSATADEAAWQDLAGKQRSLGEELAPSAADQRVPASFRLGIEQAARTMLNAGQQLSAGVRGASVEQLQDEALRMLQRLQDSFAEPKPASESQTSSPGNTPPDEARARITLAELVLLHSLQQEINQRTALLAAGTTPDQPMTPERQKAYDELAADQARLVEVIESVLAADALKPDDNAKPPTVSPDSELDKALEDAGVPGFTGR
jgi:hypothetical protein